MLKSFIILASTIIFGSICLAADKPKIETVENFLSEFGDFNVEYDSKRNDADLFLVHGLSVREAYNKTFKNWNKEDFELICYDHFNYGVSISTCQLDYFSEEGASYTLEVNIETLKNGKTKAYKIVENRLVPAQKTATAYGLNGEETLVLKQ